MGNNIYFSYNVAAERITPHITNLGSCDGMVRQKARQALIGIGTPAVPYIMNALHNRDNQTRLEAAKTLVQIRSPQAALALVESLRDPEFGVRWLAAEALVAIQRESIHPVLDGLKEHFDSIWMREGALHVFHGLQKAHLLVPSLVDVMVALSGPAPDEQVPWAAYVASQNKDFWM